MKSPKIFIPVGYGKTEYCLAQERMWGLNSQRDMLKEIINEANKRLKDVIEEGRELLSEFPCLSLQRRSE